MNRKLIIAVVLTLAMAVVIIVVAFLRHHLRIDGCLDSGGAWNYAEGRCDTGSGG